MAASRRAIRELWVRGLIDDGQAFCGLQFASTDVPEGIISCA